MPRPIPSFMDDARRLVAANRLLEATALIQARLGGPPIDTAAASPQPFQGPTIELRAERVGRGQQKRRPTLHRADGPVFLDRA